MITLKSDELELVFEPEQGGKWRSLRDRRSGAESYFNMVIELAMVPVEAENPPVLPAGQTVEWSLKIIVKESKR